MQVLLIVLFIALLSGQIGGLSLAPGAILYIHELCIGVILLYTLCTCLITRQWKKPKLFLPLLLFIGSGIISLIGNITVFPLSNIVFGSLYLVRFIFYALLYVVLVQYNISKRFLLTVLFFFGIGLTLLGFLQYWLYPDLRNLLYLGWDPHYYRLFATLLDPNFVGIILVCTALLGIYFMYTYRRMWVCIPTGLSLFALYLTYSRSSYVAFVIGLLVFGLSLKKMRFTLVLFFLFGLLVLIYPRARANMMPLTREFSSIARIGNWQRSLKIFQQSPVIGFGFNTMRYIHEDTSAGISRAGGGIDNSFLLILATTGVIGFMAFAYLSLNAIRLGRRQPDRILGAIYLSTLSAIGIHSLFNNSLFYPWVMIWIWVLTASLEVE